MTTDVTRTMQVQALYDNTKFEQGVADSETALQDLSTAAKTESDAVGAALRSMDDTAGTAMTGLGQEVEQGESKLKQLGDTAKEEIPGAMTDMADSVSDAATGLSTAFATLGPAGIAVGSVLAGIGIIMRKSQEAKAKIQADAAAWSAAYVEGLGRIDDAARRAQIDAALADPESQISKIRDTMLDITQGGLGQIIKAMYGTPSEQQAAVGNIQQAADKLRDTLENSDTITDETRAKLTTQLETYNKILDVVDKSNQARETGLQHSADQLEAEIEMGLISKDELRKMQIRNQRQKDYLETTLSIQIAMENIAIAAHDIGTGLADAWRFAQQGETN